MVNIRSVGAQSSLHSHHLLPSFSEEQKKTNGGIGFSSACMCLYHDQLICIIIKSSTSVKASFLLAWLVCSTFLTPVDIWTIFYYWYHVLATGNIGQVMIKILYTRPQHRHTLVAEPWVYYGLLKITVWDVNPCLAPIWTFLCYIGQIFHTFHVNEDVYVNVVMKDTRWSRNLFGGVAGLWKYHVLHAYAVLTSACIYRCPVLPRTCWFCLATSYL